MSTISTHVLDTSSGRPADGIDVRLEKEGALVGSGTTDSDGRVKDLVPGSGIAPGTYQLRFSVGAYFSRSSRKAFYPEVTIHFSVDDATQHYHVPLLLSAYGYSTYRGS